MPERDSSTRSGKIGRLSTYVVTNGTKIVGLYVVLKEQSGEGRNSILIVGALLALGAQTAEAILLAAIDRFFGGEDRSK